jgi:uncharacterized protein DUF2530
VSVQSRPEGEPRPVPTGDAERAGSPATAVLRDPPPPLEANDWLVTVVGTAGWAVALMVLLIVRTDIPPGQRWWIWTALAGVVMGLFALWYVPHLKRSRARAARRRAAQLTP